MKACRSIAAGLIVACLVGQSSRSEALAGYTVYTTASSYGAATTGNSTVDFSGLGAPSGSYLSEPLPAGVTEGGVNFTIDQSTSNGGLFAINGYGPHYGTSEVLSSQGSTTGNNFVITLGASSTAIAIDLNSFINNNGTFSNDPLTITLSSGQSFAYTPPADGTYGFIGVTSTVALTSIRIADSSTAAGTINLVDFTTGSAVPEPSSLVLAGIGLAGVAVRKSRRRGEV